MKELLKKIIVKIITFEANLLLRRKRPLIIAVTGSVGKTSTKDAIYEAIKGSVSARKSAKTYNSDIGVPLSILGLPSGWSNPIVWLKNIIDGLFIALFSRQYPKVLVLETGIDRPGDMGTLTSWLTPDIAVLTRFPDVPVHVEFFKDPEEVVQEKMKLVHALKDNGVVIYNHDDEVIRREMQLVRQKAIGFSRYSQSHFTVTADKTVYHDNAPAGTAFTLTHLNESVDVTIYGAIGVQHSYNIAAAAAVASQFDIPLKNLVSAMESYNPPPGRMRVIPGIKGSTIIDDSYNSSPVAAEGALLSLKELHGNGRKIAVLGDMLELGKFSVTEHEHVGKLAAECADFLITVGVRSRETAQSALEYGLDESNILQYDDEKRAGRELQNLLKPGDIVLVKGSQGMRMERIVLEVMNNPDSAEELLVRQESVWSTK